MDRRTMLHGIVALAVGGLVANAGHHRRVAAQDVAHAPGFADLELPLVTIVADDAGFTVPSRTTSGRVLMTVENRGSKELHFFAARVPDEVSDEQLAADTLSDDDPAWFDMTSIPLLGNPDWPPPGATAQGVVDITAGRWVLVDPIDGRSQGLWHVDEGNTEEAPESWTDLEVDLSEMAFSGLEAPLPAGPLVWKIANRGELYHELAILPVPTGTTAEDLEQQIADALGGSGDPGLFAPVGGQGVTAKGVTAWQRFDLAPGSYAAVCMAPSPGDDFSPHALMGMIQVFTVR